MTVFGRITERWRPAPDPKIELIPCSGLWGRAGIVNAQPSIRIIKDALFIPWSDADRPWGVFDCDGCPVRESIDLRTERHVPSGMIPRFDPSATFARADRDICLYIGMTHAHYGHFVVNSLPRWWPVLHPNCPSLIGHFPAPTAQDFDNLSFFRRIRELLGIRHDDLYSPRRPVRIPRLLVAETSFVEQFMAHRVFADLCARIGQTLWAEPEIDTVATPVYIAKSKLKSGVGKFEAEEIIEECLKSEGVDIVFPEEMDFDEQVRLLSMRQLIVGTTGSAFHTSIFAAPRRRIIGINASAEVNSNFTMIDLLNKNKAEYVFAKEMTSEPGTAFLTIHRVSNPKALAKAIAQKIDGERKKIDGERKSLGRRS